MLLSSPHALKFLCSLAPARCRVHVRGREASESVAGAATRSPRRRRCGDHAHLDSVTCTVLGLVHWTRVSLSLRVTFRLTLTLMTLLSAAHRAK